jgi:DNA-binding transcriptional regulator YdaS (Cro superfamily)
MFEAITQSIRRAGGGRALADQLGISFQAVYHWKKCPVFRTLEIERLTGIPKEQLRPDVYPPRPK